MAITLVILILTVALFRGDPMMETIQFALVLTVAAVPVALPTVLSVTMAVGARILSRHQAIVSRLASIEELAGMDVLCSDKTGTLTQNKLALGEPFLVNRTSAEQAILAAALASRAEDEDPIDLAVLAGLKNPALRDACEVLHFQPFDPVHKRTEATVKGRDGRTFSVARGAPQVILPLTANADQARASVAEAVNNFAARGYRALGVAQTNEQGRWQFLAILPLYDPPREDSKTTLEAAKQMGVRVKMVTGDQSRSARKSPSKSGLGRTSSMPHFWRKRNITKEVALLTPSKRLTVSLKVYPEHKYHIVEVLQNRGHVVGMTGDGVNDAPALKKADAGIAVSGSTDAARSAADIVLLNPGLSVIIHAIQESRKIFQRMQSSLLTFWTHSD